MALTKTEIAELRGYIKDDDFSEDEKDMFRQQLKDEGISIEETEEEEVEIKSTPKKKKKTTSKKKGVSSDDLAKAKADLKKKFGKTEEECEKIISEYKKAREKAKVGRKKRTTKLKKDKKLIKGTDVKDAGATLDSAKNKVKTTDTIAPEKTAERLKSNK